MPAPIRFPPRHVLTMLETLRKQRGDRLRIGIVSDVHGQHKRPALEAFCTQVEPDLLLCCGDLQDYRGGYGAPMIFVHGNHEAWPIVAEMDQGRRTPPGLGHLPDAVPIKVGAMRVVGIGGCRSHSPSTEHRHISEDSVDRLVSMKADIVLSHDTPIRYGFDPSRTVDSLRTVASLMAPRFWFSGHHHRFELEQFGRTTIVSLGRWPDEWGYLDLDGKSISDFRLFEPRGAYATRKAHWKNDEQAEKAVLFPLDRAGRIYGTDDRSIKRG